MPPTQGQIDDFNAQIEAGRRKLHLNSAEIFAIKAVGAEAAEDSSKYNLFLAKCARAHELLAGFNQAWDTIVLLYVRLDDADGFPSDEETELRRRTYDAYDIMKAIEINLKSEPPCPPHRESTRHHDMSSSKAFLDKLQLPYFDGNVKCWVRYRDVFSSLIHNDTSLSPVAKLHLLISSLSGEALSLINKFDITDASYPLAWQALHDAYDNERVLASALVDQILDFKMSSFPKLQDYQLFLTQVADSISAFKSLHLENPEDKLLTLIILRTLDPQTRRRFEVANTGSTFPTAESIVTFIRNQSQALKLSGQTDSWHSKNPRNSLPPKNSPNLPQRNSPRFNTKNFALTSPSTSQTSSSSSCQTASRRPSPAKGRPSNARPWKNSNSKSGQGPKPPAQCPFCQQTHTLARCPSFLGLAVNDRRAFTSKWRGCLNCLNPDHSSKECKSRWTCRISQERHHTMIHLQEDQADPCASGINAHASCHQPITVILGTARALIRDSSGRDHSVRILVDCGSHKSFITTRCATMLQLRVRKAGTKISGLGGTPVAETLGEATFRLTSLRGCELEMTAAVLQKITSPLPQHPLPREVYEYFRTHQLADPLFHMPQEIDVLLGADLFDQICTGSIYKPRNELPSVLPTIFGDIIMGPLKSKDVGLCHLSMFCQPLKTISSQLESFWRLEEPTAAPRQSPEDAVCEEHFTSTVSRTQEGRYMVRLPFSKDPCVLGSTRGAAEKRFCHIEAKFATNDKFNQAYHLFMKEYEDLGHMQQATKPSSYIIPHFGIWQKKLRVVFDASCRSNTGVSLNDVLYSGPKLQSDIRDVLTNFRVFRIAITTDIVKMYRQILLHPQDRKYQHILWRESREEEFREQELNTVTYGLTSSPFLAIRTIRQLIMDEGAAFPLACQRLSQGMFVDDIAAGADNVDEAQKLCRELINLFSRGGFQLSKWSSNLPSVLPPDCLPNQDPISPQPDDTKAIKVLGLVWTPVDDTFAYTIHQLPTELTKRTILSVISRIYDPLGFLAPVIFIAKVFMQQLWRNGLEWDEPLPPQLRDKWRDLTDHWADLTLVKIPRHMDCRRDLCRLVGFCDSSAMGYAAVIYLHVRSARNQYQSYLVAAKTKVAPAKFVSIARLELCGAFLLAKLLTSIHLPDVKIEKNYLFSDSTVALGWIHTPSHLLHTFEANRVAAIAELAPDAEWRHVRTQDNPADFASRGVLPHQIAKTNIWWEGPSWLRLPPEQWPAKNEAMSITAPIVSQAASLFTSTSIPCDPSWMMRFSRLQILVRTIVRILRYARRSTHPFTKFSDPIKPSELSRATFICARSVQRQFYPKGPATKTLAALNPFLDGLGVLRVGGRLTNSQLPDITKHPIIIPSGSHLAKLIVDDIHEAYYHSGPTLTLAILRSRFWIPSAMRFVKSQLNKCIKCFRLKPTTQKAIMAPLPSHRLTPGRPFIETGVDFAGPFTIRDSLRRKPHLSKVYIALFVCMATKAIHLEAVTSLTTEAFLATLDRFVSRRGKPRVIHSDNGTNFVGASNYIKELMTTIIHQEETITSHLARQGIEWKFIQPRSPHFGGLWEAGVKSVKSLLISTVASQPMTYEELSTILARIESALNSRPLCPLTDSPDDLDSLTPAHFLIGSALSSLPEENLESTPMNRLTRWQLVQRHSQYIWSRWRREYLHTLQQRSKWRQEGRSPAVNDLVVLIKKTSPTNSWPLARVVSVHPGSDGVVRVVTVKTATGQLFRRSIHHLALLPLPSKPSSP